MDVISSPLRRPACLAGARFGSQVALALVATQGCTCTYGADAFSVVSFAVRNFSHFGFVTPTNDTVIHNKMKPRMKWVTEPEAMTIVRFQTAWRHIARGSSSGATSSSCGVIPTIFTNPPSGSALTPYSVSPRRKDHSVGPKPTKYRVTFMPKAFAVPMCPASCRHTDIKISSANSTMPSAFNIYDPFVT